MKDFVVRKMNTRDCHTMYLAYDGEWVTTSEKANKLNAVHAQALCNVLGHLYKDALFDIVMSKDAQIRDIPDALLYL